MGDLKRADTVEFALAKLKKSWKHHRRTGHKNALFKAVIYAYNSKPWLLKIAVGEYFIAFLFNVVVTMLNLSSPFLVKHIIEYIQDDTA